MKKFLFYLALLFIPMALQADEKSVNDAKSWLAIIDKGDYAQSWQAGAVTMQLKIPQNSWVAIMTAMRKPLGEVQERSLVQENEAKDPPNLPEGDYKVLTFSTDFKNAKAAKELITMIQQSDGNWKVLTYHVGN